MFKYVYKEDGRFTIHFTANYEPVYDKFKNYKNCRHIEAPEAVYTMFEYDAIEAKPTVKSFEAHLPNR